MEGWRGNKLSKGSTMEERESAKSWVPIGEEGPLNRCPKTSRFGLKTAHCSGTTSILGGTTSRQERTNPPQRYYLQRRRYYLQTGAHEPTTVVLPPKVEVLPLWWVRALLPGGSTAKNGGSTTAVGCFQPETASFWAPI